MYIMWYDDSKRPVEQKILDAMEAYQDRYGIRPNVVMVNEMDAGAVVSSVVVRAQSNIRRYNYWVGMEER